MKPRLRTAARAWALGLVATLTILAAPLPARAEVPANGRAWELVSPKEPIAARVTGVLSLEEDDSRLIYFTLGPPPEAISGALLGNSTFAVRNQGGWSRTPVGFPYSIFSDSLFEQLAPVASVAFSADRLTSLWLSSVPVTSDSPPEGQMALYRLAPDGALTMIAPIKEGAPLFYEGLVNLSADGEKVVFSSQAHLLPGDASRTEGESIYEQDGTGLRLVDVSNGGSLLSTCGSSVSRSGGVSTTGNRVFFTTKSCPEVGRIYLRENGSSTVEVSASECTRVDCGPRQFVAFAGATPSGASVFMVTNGQLTNDDVDEARDLYRYDVDSGTLVLLTPAQPEANGQALERIVRVSPDGARVYFGAEGRLVTGEGPETGVNLYLADQSGLHFVAPVQAEPRVELARDGHDALFATAASLVEADTDSNEDVYLYDSTNSTYTRLSAGPFGGNGSFDATIRAPLAEGEAIFEERRQSYRSITEDGKDAFFSTKEKLVSEDVNESTDVYEWNDGHLGLVSSGTGIGAATFGGVSASGRTALFKTSATLTSDDVDGGDGDIYAARVGGGFPPPPEPPPACVGTSCERASGTPLERPSPGSASLRTKGKGGRIELRGIEWKGGAKSALKGVISVTARVPSPGRVSASVWMPRGSGKRITLAHGSEGAIRPGKIRILLGLTKAGRAMLARRDQLTGQLVVGEADDQLTRSLRLPSGAAR